jgi:hypothetical protein
VADLCRLGPVTIGPDATGSIARALEAVLLAEVFPLIPAPGVAANRAGHGFAGGGSKPDPRDAWTIADLVAGDRSGVRSARTRFIHPHAPVDTLGVAAG